jgi:hypothetical protein
VDRQRAEIKVALPLECRERHLLLASKISRGQRLQADPLSMQSKVAHKEVELDGTFAAEFGSRFSDQVAESRANHGLENFGDSLYPYGKYGRHDWTRTSDLYRVKVHLTSTYNNFRKRSGTLKPL